MARCGLWELEIDHIHFDNFGSLFCSEPCKMLGLVLFLASVGLQNCQRVYDRKSRREDFHNLDLIISKHIPLYAGITIAGIETLVLGSLEARLGQQGALDALNSITLLEAVQMAAEVMRRRPVLLPNEPDDGWAQISYCEYVRRAHLRDIERPAVETADVDCMPSPLTGEANVFVSMHSSSWLQSGVLLRTALDTLRSQCTARFREHNGVSNKLGHGGKREWFLYWEPFSEPLDLAHVDINGATLVKSASTSGNCNMRIERYEQRRKAIQSIGHVLIALPFDFMTNCRRPATTATADTDTADCSNTSLCASALPPPALTVGSLREPAPLLDLLYCHLLAREKADRVQSDHAAALLLKARAKKEAEEAIAKEKAARRAARESNRRRHSLVSSGGSDIQVEAISISISETDGAPSQGQLDGNGGNGGEKLAEGKQEQDDDDLSGAPTESATAAATAAAPSDVPQQPSLSPSSSPSASGAPAAVVLSAGPLPNINYRWDLCLPVQQEEQQLGGASRLREDASVPTFAADPLGLQRLCLSQCGEHYDALSRLLVHACQAAYQYQCRPSAGDSQPMQAGQSPNAGLLLLPSFHFTIDAENDVVREHEHLSLFHAATQLDASRSPSSSSSDGVRQLADVIRSFGSVFLSGVRASTAVGSVCASSSPVAVDADVAAAVEKALAMQSAENDRLLLTQADRLIVRALLSWMGTASSAAVQQRGTAASGGVTVTAVKGKDKDAAAAATATANAGGTPKSLQALSLYREMDCNQNYARWASSNRSAISFYRPHGLGMAGGRVLARQFLDQILYQLGSRLSGQYVRDDRWSSAGYCSETRTDMNAVGDAVVPSAVASGASSSAVLDANSPNRGCYVFVQDYVPFQESTHGVTGELLVSAYSVQLHVRLGSVILRLIRSQIERQCATVLDNLLANEDPSPLQRLAVR
jgi:hypothetical protein